MTMKQLTEPQKLWIAALRSGEYEQGPGRLLKNGHYCCLGVACELAIKGGITLKKDYIGDNSYAFAECDTEAPPVVVKWLGLRNELGVFDEGFSLTGERSLAHANDEGSSFEDIADFIETHPEAVFLAQPPQSPIKPEEV